MNLSCTLLFCALWVLTPHFSAAQPGAVTVHAEPAILEAINVYKKFATAQREVPGYRIQLAASGNRQHLTEIKVRFLSLFPEVATHIEYQSPQFKLRVGDFRARNEAEYFLEEVKKHFPTAFLVMGKIQLNGVGW